jgi:hypothetical protein
MSIQEKLGNISKKIENKKEEEKTIEKNISYSELIKQKEEVIKKIKLLNDLYSDLKVLYLSSRSDLGKIEKFKNEVKEVEDYFNKNEKELLTINIESIEDLLISPDFKDDQKYQDILKYREDGFVRQDGEEVGEKLRDKISRLSEIKAKIKEELPDEKLDFTSKAREESLDKIKQHIDYLSNTRLKELDGKIIESRKEILSVLKKMLKERIDEMFLDDNFIRSQEKEDSNYQFLPDKILELCSDDLWIDVKNSFIEEMYNKKDELSEKGGINSKYKNVFNKDSYYKDSLNAEKLVFDVEKLKNNNKELIKNIVDKENFIAFDNNFFHECARLLHGNGIIIKDNKVFQKDSIIDKEYFDSKNEEGKIIFEKTRENIVKILNDLNNKLKIKVFDGKDEKNELREYKEYLSNKIDEINKIDSNEKIFQEDNYSFINKAYKISEISINSLLKKSRVDEIREASKKIKEEYEVFKNFFNEEKDRYSNFSNDNYHLDSTKYGKESNYSVPYYDLKYKTKELFPENNNNRINQFIDNLEGKSFSYEEIKKVFSDEKEKLNEIIKTYPNNKEVVAKFTGLLGEIKEWSNYDKFVSKLAIKDPQKATKARNNNYGVRNFFL